MISFRPKLGSEQDREWICCGCMHVRTATILLGVWHLVLHLIALGFVTYILRDPRLIAQMNHDTTGVDGIIGGAMPTPLSNIDTSSSPFPQTDSLSKEHSLIYHDVDYSALVTVFTLAITLMLIYGASRGMPTHLLPFFCLQIFDFVITVLTVVGYLCFLRSIEQLVREAKRVPWRPQLLQLPSPVLFFVVLTAVTLTLALKGYCISVVWRCYKYLTMRVHALHSLTPFVISSEGLVSPAQYPGPAPVPDHSSLLPDYEEAVKQTPPPSYRAATRMAQADPAATTVPEQTSATAATANTVVMLPQQGSQAQV